MVLILRGRYLWGIFWAVARHVARNVAYEVIAVCLNRKKSELGSPSCNENVLRDVLQAISVKRSAP